MLSIHDLDFSYRDKKVLNGINLDMDKGHIIALLGCNGVGKSTLMKCICGILSPQTGSITIEDKELGSMSRRDIAKKIGYVPQNSVMPHMSVFDCVLLGRRPHMELAPSDRDLDIVSDMIE